MILITGLKLVMLTKYWWYHDNSFLFQLNYAKIKLFFSEYRSAILVIIIYQKLEL